MFYAKTIGAEPPPESPPPKPPHTIPLYPSKEEVSVLKRSIPVYGTEGLSARVPVGTTIESVPPIVKRFEV